MIKAKNIHKSYGELEVLKGVNLEIHKGEIVSIVGESGAGKSTLLQILGTLDLPSDIQKHETEILLFGESFLKMNDKELSKFRNENIGFVFQHHQLLPEFTALENVMMPIRIAGKNVKDYKEKAMQLFEELNVVDRIHYKPKMLSGGEAQRVAVIRALINSPKIIFADEPTGNLDSQASIEIMELFAKLHKEGSTVVVVTHEDNIAAYTHRILTFKDGVLQSDRINENPTPFGENVGLGDRKS